MRYKSKLLKKCLMILLTVTLFMNNLLPASVVYAANGQPSATLEQEAVDETGEYREAEPTQEPATEPTVKPSENPTTEPTAEPTTEPATEPTSEPEPTEEPVSEEPEEKPEVEEVIEEVIQETSVKDSETVKFDLAAAQKSLQDILNEKFILALVYLCDSYQVKAAPTRSGDTVVTVYSGQTVEILGVELTDNEFWYRVGFYLNGENQYTGYIQREKLAYSDELLLAWEETYVIPLINSLPNPTKVSPYNMTVQTSVDIEQFPESYKETLYALKAKYPKWIFVKVNAADSWSTAVTNEMTPPERSLVYSSAAAAWKGALYDSPWYIATKLAVECCMDPRNYFTEKAVFQFEQLTYNASYHSESALNSILASTFMKGKIPDETTMTYAQAFMKLGQQYGVSPYHFAARVYQEQGQGTSPLISGKYPGYEGYYNYYNVSASGVGEQVIISGLSYAKTKGWNTRYKSLDGGSATIGNNYIKQGQDTLYLQKFNVVSGVYYHQYMQNIQAPTSEATKAWQFYNASGALNNPFVFKIPVYSGMPKDPCPADPIVKATKVVLEKATYEMELGDTLTLCATVSPGNTTDKSVTWKSSNTAVATIDDQGKITPKKAGQINITVTTGDGTNLSATASVTIRDGIQTFTLNRSETQLTVGEMEMLTATAISYTGKVMTVTWESSDPAVATVNVSGQITARSVGNATISATVDNQVLTCLVRVVPTALQDEEQERLNESGYPIPQNDKISVVQTSYSLQSYGNDADSEGYLQIQNQYGTIIDPSLFAYQSANPAVVQVEANGRIIPNPDTEVMKKTTVKVTAEVKDDPLKRKVTFSVVVLLAEQVNQVTIQQLTGNETVQSLTEGEALYDEYDKESLKTYTFQAIYSGAKGEIDAKVKWSLTDTGVASLKVNRDNTVTVTMKKVGSTGVKCQVQDVFKTESNIVIGAINTLPGQVEKTITLNKYRSTDDQGKVLSEPFTLVEMNGCEIIFSDAAPISLLKGKEDMNIQPGNVVLMKDTATTYRLAWEKEYLEGLAKGNYQLTYNIKTTGSDKLGQKSSTFDNLLVYTLKVNEKKPSATINKAVFNLQNKEETSIPLTIKTGEVITDIQSVDGQNNGFDNYFYFSKSQDIWYVNLTDAGKELKGQSLTGKVNITMAGYQNITVNLPVTLQNKKITLVQSSLPMVQSQGTIKVTTSIKNKSTGELLQNYKIEEQESAKLQVEGNADGTLTLTPKPGVTYKNGETVSAKLKIMATKPDHQTAIWQESLPVTVSVKVYSTTAPKITMGKTSFVLNLNSEKEGVTTTFGSDRTNQVILPAGEWKLYRYNSNTKNYQRAYASTEPVAISYHRTTGQITLSLNTDNRDLLKTGKYQYRLSAVMDGYESANKDFTVTIKDNIISAAISVSGKLDLLKRNESTMTGKVTLKNVDGRVAGITLYEADADHPYTTVNQHYYAVLNTNHTFAIKARTGAVLYAKSTEIPVKVTMGSGEAIYTKMTVKPTQSVPSVKNPETRTFYLNSKAVQTEYDMSGYLPVNITLSSIKIANAPKGFVAEANGNKLIIKTDEKGIKKGTYSIKVNLYFKGAQPLYGYPDGKPVSKTIKILLK